MRWISYRHRESTLNHSGIIDGDLVLGAAPGTRLLDLLGTPDAFRDAATLVRAQPSEVVRCDEVELLAPVAEPPSVRDFLSFERHLRNGRGADPDPVWFERPVFYFSNPAAIRGPHDPVPISPGSHAFDYELEIGAVIGCAGTDLDLDEAHRCIAGYTIMCDWSARDIQRSESRLGLGPSKGKDGATTLGPWLVTPDEVEDARSGAGYALAMDAYLNGERLGGGSWSEINWSFEEMVAHASTGTRLRPGDVIGSGTVGTGCLSELHKLHPNKGHRWLQPGDVVTLAVERLGAIEARIVTYEPEQSAGC